MKTPPPNAQLRSYTEFDFDDNPPFKGELTTMFGQLAMCVNPHAGYGAVLGALIGDAAGGVLEFMGQPPKPKEAKEALEDMPGGGVFSLAPGQFTDDGEMTVTLLQTLCNTQGAYRADLVAQAYCQWEGSAPFDIGIATRSALRVNRDRRQEAKGLAALVQAQAANNNADSKANGSLMRATPLGIAACGCTVEETIEMVAADAAMTHPNATCISATTACAGLASLDIACRPAQQGRRRHSGSGRLFEQ